MYKSYPHKYRVVGLPLDVEAWVYLDPSNGRWFATLEGGEIDSFSTKEGAEEAVRVEYRKSYVK